MHPQTHFHVLEIKRRLHLYGLHTKSIVYLLNGFCAISFKILMVPILKLKVTV